MRPRAAAAPARGVRASRAARRAGRRARPRARRSPDRRVRRCPRRRPARSRRAVSPGGARADRRRSVRRMRRSPTCTGTVRTTRCGSPSSAVENRYGSRVDPAAPGVHAPTSGWHGGLQGPRTGWKTCGFCLTTNRCSSSVQALPRVLRSPEPHHPHLLVDGARGGLRVVAVMDSAGLSDLAIADELVRRRAEIDRLEAEFAQLAWTGHQRGIGAADGSPSTQAWLRKHTGMREGDARASIEAGRVSELLPKVGAAWRDGQITGGAAKTVTGARVEGHDLKLRALEDLFLDLALANDMRELKRACAHFRDCARADGTCPREHDGLTISDTYDGTRIIHSELRSTAAEIVTNAIHAYTDPPSEGDDRTPARRRADG